MSRSNSYDEAECEYSCGSDTAAVKLASLEGSYARHRHFFDIKGTHLLCGLFSHRLLTMLQTVSGNIDSNSTQLLLSVVSYISWHRAPTQ